MCKPSHLTSETKLDRGGNSFKSESLSQINIAFHRYRLARQSIVTLKSKSITVPFVNNSNSFIEYVWSGCGKLKARFGCTFRRVIKVLRVYRIEGVTFVSFSAARFILVSPKMIAYLSGFLKCKG